MNTLMYDTYTIFWRELKRYKKSRSGVLIRLIQPAIWIIVIVSNSKILFWALVALITTVALKEYYSICLKNTEKTLKKIEH